MRFRPCSGEVTVCIRLAEREARRSEFVETASSAVKICRMATKRITLPRFFLYTIMVVGSLLMVGQWTVSNSGILTNYEDRIDDSEVNETGVNLTWVKMREDLLGRRSGVVSKVVIMAYARGGSTLLSDVFNIDINNTVLWYEALTGFHSYYTGVPEGNEMTLLYYDDYTRKTMDRRMLFEMTDYMINLFDLNVKKIPIQTLAHDVFMQRDKAVVFGPFSDCMNEHNASVWLYNCYSIVGHYCYEEESSSNLTNSPYLQSSLRCSDILKTVRRWNPQRNVVDLDTAMELLYRCARDKKRQDEIGKIVTRDCDELRKQFKDVEAKVLSGGGGGGQNQILRWSSGKDRVLHPSFRVKSELSLITPGMAMKDQCRAIKHKFLEFLRHNDCERDLSETTYYCREAFDELRRRTKLVVQQIHRAFLGDFEPLVQRLPDVRLVHYVRDPRAVSVSRAEKQYHTFRWGPDWTIVDETKIHCIKMRVDMEQSKRLQRIYPGSVVTMRYEDLILRPNKFVAKLYDYFGRPVPVGLDAWIRNTMNAPVDNGMYGVRRTNGTSHVDAWRSKVTEAELKAMNRNCEDILVGLGYAF